MDSHTETLIQTLRSQCELFLKGKTSLEELQAVTEGLATAFESYEGEIILATRRLAGALEHIRWMSLPDEQLSDAKLQINEFEHAIASRLANEQKKRVEKGDILL